MKQILFFVVFLFTSQLFSQKQIERIFSASGIENLWVDSNQITALTIISKKTDQIKIEMIVHGESASSTSLTSKTRANSLLIGTSFTPFYTPENDKLAAHKVLAVDVIITVPETIKLNINLASATLRCTGKISQFTINLDSGNCFLTNILGSGIINTKNATVFITPNPDISVLVNSETFQIEDKIHKKAKYTVHVVTKRGDVFYQ